MEQNLYNSNDEQYKHVINLLKELPKVKADDNFEYNLKVKIQNKNFETKTDKKFSFFPWKVLIPVGSFATAAVVISLFFLNADPENFENPFQISPKLRTESAGNLLNSQSITSNSEVNKNDVIVKSKSVVSENISDKNIQNEVKKSQEIAQSFDKSKFPFNNYKSTNLDQALQNNDNNPRTIDRRATLANRSNSLIFDGFYIREEVDKKYVETLKAKLDSLKREMYKQKER
ncbi:MAG: hypothetical protein IPH62_02320 [Ignavibacteriae bacterium]|nr:hypothetical protein [Ignavibacteriota bacterium]